MSSRIAEEQQIQPHQVIRTVELLDGGNTVPFIARYRKEMTGSLDEEKIRAIEERMKYLRHLQERKDTILKSIEEQGKLTSELAERIEAAVRLQEVEDLYLPYRPKRRTRAMIAREKGLEALAAMILAQEIEEGDPLYYAGAYVDEGKGIEDAAAALDGARDIVAEIISEDADIRGALRERTEAKGYLTSEARESEKSQHYEVYKSHSEPVRLVPPHRILAINRGEREKALTVGIEAPEEEMQLRIEADYMKNRRSIFAEQMILAVQDAYRRLIAPAIEREIRNLLTERADDHAIKVFGRNLRALLMAPPLRGKIILGVDPGFRTGCKLAVIDSTGKYLEGATIYPHEPQRRWQEAKETILELLEDYRVEIVAIGNGTASRETEKLVAEAIGESDADVHYTIVNEAGASVYSASPLAKKEFPELEASMRGNISIARRLLDPLSELVKIDPKSIGVGLYQHDVDQIKLADTLDQVVESCVNQVGVDVNTASASLLKYVAGINSRVADQIVKYREEKGRFLSREEFKKVKGLGENAFTQAAGFMRISESDCFFDGTAVHPESYGAAQRLLDQLGVGVEEVRRDGGIVGQRLRQQNRTIEQLSRECGCGLETLSDIIASLEKPARDPRDEMPGIVLRSDVLSMDDLTVGMILKGTVRNVVDFGAFVDIGVKEDGLVHLSRMAKKYVKNPLDVVSVGDVVEVKIVGIDQERGRIGLSLVLE